MMYLVKVISKLLFFPVVLVMFFLAYLLFIISPDLHKFKFKMER
jgi:hypothetical protein